MPLDVARASASRLVSEDFAGMLSTGQPAVFDGQSRPYAGTPTWILPGATWVVA